MGEQPPSSTPPTPHNIVALATGFQHVIRGSRGMSKSWSAERLGPLNRLVRDETGVWRPDGLTATRIVLRRVIDAYRDAGEGPRSRQSVPATADAIANEWGVSSFPAHDPAGDELLDRADLSDWVYDDDPVAVDDDDRAGARPARIVLDDTRRSRWQKRVTAHPRALEAAARDTGLVWVTLDPEYTNMRTAGHPRWSTDERLVRDWPGEPMVGGERAALLARLGAYLGDDPRVIRVDEDPTRRADQMLHVLRRLAADRHAKYLGKRLDTQHHFLHLRHSLVRPWFESDLLDLGGAEEFDVTITRSVERGQLLRSQASIARMEFYSVIHEWDAAAASAVLNRRSSARRVFLGLERLADPLERFAERVASRPLHITDKRDDARTAASKSALPDFVNDAEPAAREIFQFALEVRVRADRRMVSEYISRRRMPDSEFDRLLPASKLTLMLADQSVDLDSTGTRDPRLHAHVTDLLRQSSRARPEYAAFVNRDRAMLGTKSLTSRGLERAFEEGVRGLAELDRMQSSSGSSFIDFRIDERAMLETKHQMDLALAGAAARALEDLMRASPDEQSARPVDKVAAQISGALHWSAETVKALTLLDERGALPTRRHVDGYLASAAWRVPTRIMRHRALCAAFVVAAAYGITSSKLPSEYELDVAYADMISTEEITSDQIPQVMQGVLLHSFLTAGRLPVVRPYAVELQEFDFITADVDFDAGRTHTVHLDGRQLMLATLSNFARDWDYGVVGTIPVGSKTARILNTRSHGEFSRWRTYIQLLGFTRSGGERDVLCLECRWSGAANKVRGANCPRCDSTMLLVTTPAGA